MYRLYAAYEKDLYSSDKSTVYELIGYGNTYNDLHVNNLDEDLVLLSPKDYYQNPIMSGTIIAKGDITYNALMPVKFKDGVTIFLTVSNATKEAKAYYETFTREELIALLVGNGS